jgi:metallophosphoesterase (TIGR00282 family)
MMKDANVWTVLFVADIVGQPGLEITTRLLPRLKEERQPDLVIANGENGANNGKGLTKAIAKKYFELGIDVITGGNHSWENPEIYKIWQENNERVLRPANYPKGNPGKGTVIVDLPDGAKAAVVNLQGRTYLYSIDCPFKLADDILHRLEGQANFAIIDFHAEASAEKMALAWYLDGRVSAVIGTHTHVPTADERILPNGTAYITDAGMTGPFDSVIGMKKDIAIKKFMRQIPFRFEPATENPRLCAVLVKIDKATAKAVSIERISAV